jgi:hypothetical protein
LSVGRTVVLDSPLFNMGSGFVRLLMVPVWQSPVPAAPRIVFLCALIIVGACAHDTYQERADLMKDHVETFYSSLKANRVEAAVHANEQIEAMADQMADTVRTRARQQGTTRAEREFALMKTARETAAQNWIALGQYFAIKKQADRARATYRRVIDTYTNPAERTYREQAARALKDLEMLSPATHATPSP